MRIRIGAALALSALCFAAALAGGVNVYAQEEAVNDSSWIFDKLRPSKVQQIDYQKIQPNEIGDIMIIMYHGLYADNPPAIYHRTIEGFKSDLRTFYDEGYRLISLSDLINNDIKVKAGYTPLVLTFDDGLSTAFSFVEKDGKLLPRTACAVDILNKFSEEHPDFGKTATFFINGSGEAFKGAGTLEQRLRYLTENGYEIGNHTYSHAQLSRLGASKIQEEIGRLDQMIRSILPGYVPVCLAYPYGERPKASLRELALNGEYDSQAYSYGMALREGQSGASAAPNNTKYDPLNMPRVRGTDNAKYDLGWCFGYYRDNPDKRYISDGNPDTISLQKKYENMLDIESLGEKKPIIYELP